MTLVKFIWDNDSWFVIVVAQQQWLSRNTQTTLPHRHRLTDRANYTKKKTVETVLIFVEVARTEPNLHIPLIVLLFQNVVWQQVSVMNTSWRIILIYLQNHFLILLYQI